MILLIVFFFTACLLGFGTVFLCVLGTLAINAFPCLFGVLCSILNFWAEVLMFVVLVAIEMFIAFGHFCVQTMPHVTHAFRNMYQFLRDLDINGIFTDVWNSVQPYREWIIYCWGLVLMQLYFFKTQVHNFFHNVMANDQNNRDNAEDVNAGNEEYDDYRHVENRQHSERGGEARAGLRNRRRPRASQQANRLYPVLPDIDDNSNEFLNDNDVHHGDDYVRVDRNVGFDVRECIVCFDRERRTAVFPCGHTNMCEQCTRSVMIGSNRCPVCQRIIAEYRNIYL